MKSKCTVVYSITSFLFLVFILFINPVLGYGKQLFGKHEKYKVPFSAICGFGWATSLFFIILNIFQIYAIINDTPKDTVCVITMGFVSMLFLGSLLMNSFLHHTLVNKKSLLGFSEYLLPFFLLQFLIIRDLYEE